MDIMTEHINEHCLWRSGKSDEAKVLEDMYGDGYPCGFAWVQSYVKGEYQ